VKVILDEMLPIGLRELLPAHDVVTAAYAGLAGIPNGELISRAIAAGFGAIVTLDLGILHQQNLAAQDIGFVLIPDNDVDRIRPYSERLEAAISEVTPGSVVHVGGKD